MDEKIPTLKDFVELEIRVPVMTVLLCLGHIKTWFSFLVILNVIPPTTRSYKLFQC